MDANKPDEVQRSTKRKQNSYRMDRRRGWAWWILLAVLAMVAVYAAVKIAGRMNQDEQLRQVNDANRALVQQAEPTAAAPATVMALPEVQQTGHPQVTAAKEMPITTTTPAPLWYKPSVLPKYQALYEQNSDLVGWLKVNCVYRIDFAVVQGNNGFYETHDFSKQANVNGAAFLDETCSLWPRDDNLIIYAHNMKTGEMFGELHHMQQMSTLKKDPFVTFDTIYEQGSYIPVAAYLCSVDPAKDHFQFYVRNFDDADQLAEYTARAKELSAVKLGTDVQPGDDLLTLVTCYDEANKQRMAVLLRKVRPGETEAGIRDMMFK